MIKKSIKALSLGLSTFVIMGLFNPVFSKSNNFSEINSETYTIAASSTKDKKKPKKKKTSTKKKNKKKKLTPINVSIGKEGFYPSYISLKKGNYIKVKNTTKVNCILKLYNTVGAYTSGKDMPLKVKSKIWGEYFPKTVSSPYFSLTGKYFYKCDNNPNIKLEIQVKS